METTRWEYLTILITYDTRKKKDWVVKFVNQPPIVGMQRILERYCADGWELVTLNLERYRAAVGFAEYIFEPRAYRATFKRRLAGEHGS